MHVTKVVSSSSVSTGYSLFMVIAKRILGEPSQSVVADAFDAQSSQKSFMSFISYLPLDLARLTALDLTSPTGKMPIRTWVE